MANILISGANGKLGRLVVRLLLEAKAGNIIAGTRNPDNVADLVAKGATARVVDFDDEAGLADAFKGIDRLLIISTDAIHVKGLRLKQHQNAVKAAKEAGVSFVAYTSMPRPDTGSPIPFAPDHFGTEHAIKQSGMKYAILRDAWYMDSLPLFMTGPLKTGKWLTTAREGRIAHVAREDCARVAAAVLQNPVESATYDLTGAAAYTTREIAAIAAETLGKPLEVIDVSETRLAESLEKAGVPDAYVAFFIANDANTRAGNVDIQTDVVEKLTGRAPIKLRDYFAANKAAFGV